MTFRGRMEQSRQRVINSEDVTRPIYDPEERDLFGLLNDNNYPKGGRVLQMLRGIVGDAAFFAGIQAYYDRYLHSAVPTEDFRDVMEEVARRDLGWFFQEWIYEPGFPTFEIESEWIPDPTDRGGSVDVKVRQVQQDDWPTFRVPLEIGLTSDGETRREYIEVFERVTKARLRNFGSEPDAIVLDPDGWVLKGGN